MARWRKTLRLLDSRDTPAVELRRLCVGYQLAMMRFIYLGMIAEVARHAGHADILAKQIQAATTPSSDSAQRLLHRPRQ